MLNQTATLNPKTKTDKCSECGGDTETVYESRENGYTEAVTYCYECGMTATG